MKSRPGKTTGTSAPTARRIARSAEIALLVLTLAGIALLMFVWLRLDVLLSPAESPDLVRARLLRGVLSLAVPLIALLLIAALRGRARTLMTDRFGSAVTFRSAQFMWLVVMTMIVLVLVIDMFVIINGFHDIDFDPSLYSLFFRA